ncbi:hypothetical protein OG292_36200 [Streptomyces sp. NBC_01511]|uniref:hypothetical protein n=1 Tax=Streptomyces sp. NBC_01511 TaxID=2903889 RepID=UPI0038683772
MPTHRRATDDTLPGKRPGVDEAEAALVEHYPRLVRLAYLTLPPSLGRHRRVLTAHAVVQRVLPRSRKGDASSPVPAQRGTTGAAFAWMRERVVRDALDRDGRPRSRRALVARWLPQLPAVVGLRLFPRAGGGDELALDQALFAVGSPARAALALLVLEGMAAAEVRALLTAAGVRDPAGALRTAERLASERGGRTEALLGAPEFDPCTVQTRPTDLLRRRHRRRVAGAATVVVALACSVLIAMPGHDAREPAAVAGRADGAALARALDPALLERASGDAWSDTSRVDFSVWPARGDRTGDPALLERALRVWGKPGPAVRVSATTGTGTVPPAAPPRLLYAGEVGGAAVVLLHDGQRVARYAEPVSGDGAPALDFARTDDADVTTAAAVVVSRGPDGVRYLLAPWIAESTTRDLLAPETPDTPADDLDVSQDGVTGPVPSPSPGGDCSSWPVLRLRSSEKIVERHAFLVTDLGDLSPAHLTYTPLPGTGAPARQPREATGGAALASWARTACSLRSLRGSGVRAVNNWAFAEQKLPETGARSTWVCTRADSWRGPGRIMVQFQQPASSPVEPSTVVAQDRDTASCSRFGQHVLAGTRWKAPSGTWFLLAAGSRDVTRITATGGVRADEPVRTLAVRAPRESSVDLTGRLADGQELRSVR